LSSFPPEKAVCACVWVDMLTSLLVLEWLLSPTHVNWSAHLTVKVGGSDFQKLVSWLMGCWDFVTWATLYSQSRLFLNHPQNKKRQDMPWEQILKELPGWVPVTHAYNSSYLGGWDQEDCGLRSAQAKPSWDPISTNNRVWWHKPVIPATAGNLKWADGSLGRSEQKTRPYLQNNQSKKGWRYSSSDRPPAYGILVPLKKYIIIKNKQ
jgi:hypothetical protein